MPKNPEHEGSPRLITPQQIEQEYGIKRSTLYTYRHRPSFPQPVKVEGSIKTFYRADEVAAWLAANPKQQGKRTDLAPPQQGDPVTTIVDARKDLYAFAMQGKEHSPDNSEKASEKIDAFRAAVLREAAQRLYTALFPAVYDDMGQKAAEGVNRAVSELRRWADEKPEA